MKKPISVTVRKELISTVKAYVAERKTSVFQLVENYFQELIKPDELPK